MLTKIFHEIDDFCLIFNKEISGKALPEKTNQTISKCRLSLSEVMTIAVFFHFSKYRTFKHYYLEYVCKNLSEEFPNLLSYNRFIEVMQSSFVPLVFYLNKFRSGKCTGLTFIDSTPIKVCHNRRISQHKVFKQVAQRGKSSMGWFFGFKLHLVVNEIGEIIHFSLTPGNTDDRNRNVIKDLLNGVIGKLFGDKGYISAPLKDELLESGIELITRVKKNMKKQLLPLFDKILLRKRAVIETVNDELKNICQIEHSRHRSGHNFLVNIISGLVAYSFKPKKPAIKFSEKDIKLLGNLPAII